MPAFDEPLVFDVAMDDTDLFGAAAVDVAVVAAAGGFLCTHAAQ